MKTAEMTAYDAYNMAQGQFDRIAELLNLEPEARDFLRHPVREYHIRIPVRLDDNSVKVFTGYRVQHNDARGPCKGGIRFHPLETVSTLRALAMGMSWKAALLDLPLGGSSGGVICDPHNLSRGEEERLCRGWVRQLARNIGPTRDIIAPDIMAGSQQMLWMLDEYEHIAGEKQPGLSTGKAGVMASACPRVESTGVGVALVVREALKRIGLRADQARASVQGFGMVAQHAVATFIEMGGTVTSVSSWCQEDGTAYTYRKRDGIDLKELRGITNLFGDINKDRARDFGYEVSDGDDWLKQPVEILIPAALENQITSENAKDISHPVQIIAEGANGPTTPSAEKELNSRNIYIIPDLLANAGGITGGYLEQVQSSNNLYWSKDEVLSRLDIMLTNAFTTVSEFADKRRLSMRDAALAIAIDRVATASSLRGWI